MNEEQRKKRNERQYQWQVENTDRINFRMPKGRKEKIQSCAKAANVTASEWINAAIVEKINSNPADIAEEKESILDFIKTIPDLTAYARSSGMTEAEYIKAAVLEKMQRQDEEYKEEITREKINE